MCICSNECSQLHVPRAPVTPVRGAIMGWKYDSFLSKEDKIMVIGSQDDLNDFKDNI